mmetsp:Transcript_30229/g.51692  ORF Transcript_30229/g.51692 Transcript_30229/m.51692 type:complete len:210 (-) Transcript_30229:2297-2926(-)
MGLGRRLLLVLHRLFTWITIVVPTIIIVIRDRIQIHSMFPLRLYCFCHRHLIQGRVEDAHQLVIEEEVALVLLLLGHLGICIKILLWIGVCLLRIILLRMMHRHHHNNNNNSEYINTNNPITTPHLNGPTKTINPPPQPPPHPHPKKKAGPKSGPTSSQPLNHHVNAPSTPQPSYTTLSTSLADMMDIIVSMTFINIILLPSVGGRLLP